MVRKLTPITSLSLNPIHLPHPVLITSLHPLRFLWVDPPITISLPQHLPIEKIGWCLRFNHTILTTNATTLLPILSPLVISLALPRQCFTIKRQCLIIISPPRLHQPNPLCLPIPHRFLSLSCSIGRSSSSSTSKCTSSSSLLSCWKLLFSHLSAHSSTYHTHSPCSQACPVVSGPCFGILIETPNLRIPRPVPLPCSGSIRIATDGTFCMPLISIWSICISRPLFSACHLTPNSFSTRANYQSPQNLQSSSYPESRQIIRRPTNRSHWNSHHQSPSSL